MNIAMISGFQTYRFQNIRLNSCSSHLLSDALCSVFDFPFNNSEKSFCWMSQGIIL